VVLSYFRTKVLPEVQRTRTFVLSKVIFSYSSVHVGPTVHVRVFPEISISVLSKIDNNLGPTFVQNDTEVRKYFRKYFVLSYVYSTRTIVHVQLYCSVFVDRIREITNADC
jgi:hypothetical protein